MRAVVRATKSKASFQLAINIIEEQFGPLAKIVAEVMSRFDNMKLKEIVKEIKKTHPKSEVSKQKKVQDILASFCQHNILLDNCVDNYERNTTFTLDVDAIIFRLRCDKMRNFLQHVKYKDDDITGIAAVEIFRVLWKVGRMKISDLVDKAAESLMKSGMKKVTRTKIKDTLDELYEHGYIHDVPKIIGSMDIEENGCDTSQKSSKRRKIVDEDEEEDEVMNEGEDSAPIRVNTDRFFRSFRISNYRDKCIEIISLDPLLENKKEANRVMKCFFDTIETEFKGNINERVNQEYVTKDSEDYAQTQKVLNSLILDSISECPTLLTQISVNKEVWFRFSWKSVLKRMRQDIIVDIVQERYGTDHNRIFRLLLCSTYLEEKQVSHRALIEPKKTRQVRSVRARSARISIISRVRVYSSGTRIAHSSYYKDTT